MSQTSNNIKKQVNNKNLAQTALKGLDSSLSIFSKNLETSVQSIG